MSLATLVRNWWMMGIRGGLAIAFGLSLLLWPGVTLSIVVLLFALYAIADGAWAVVAAVRASERFLEAWPVALEGVVSVALGTVALLAPMVVRTTLHLVAWWGIITGLLEIVTALGLSRAGAGFWLLGTGGLSSLFLAALILMVPHADTDFVVRVIAGYALAFGVLVTLAAARFPHRRTAAAAAR